MEFPLETPIAGVTVRGTGLEDGRKHFPAMAAFYAERARGGVGLMVTGGFSPNIEGWLLPLGGKLASSASARSHRVITDAVHEEGGKIALQILHAGRYGYHPLAVSASRVKSPISPFAPRALSSRGVEQRGGIEGRARLDPWQEARRNRRARTASWG
mgnify:CR=1 FL=1